MMAAQALWCAAFDVGVKHFSLCILTDAFEIVNWEVLILDGKTIEQQVGSLWATLVDRNSCLEDIDEVVIERQVRANIRMSCIASALLMFFLQRGVPVSYVEPAKKMDAFRDFLARPSAAKALPTAGYRRTKAQSVMCARFVLEGRWLEWFEDLPKKDDASDAFCMAWSHVRGRPVQL